MSFISFWNDLSQLPASRIILIGILVSLTAYAAVSDVREFRIPNRVPVTITALFFVFFFTGRDCLDLKAHAIFAAITFAVFFGFYVLGWIGAGDVKLIAALSLWAGPEAGLQFFLALGLAGNLFALFLLFLRKTAGAGKLPHGRMPPRLIRWAERGVCPYGLPIFVSLIALVPHVVHGTACTAV